MTGFNKVGTTRTRAGREVAVFAPTPGKVVKENPVGPLITGFGGKQPLAPPDGFAELAVQGYALNSIARAAIDKMAGFCASIPLKLQKHAKMGVWADMPTTNDDEHPLMQLLSRPNPGQCYGDFVKAIMGFRFLSGQSYVTPNGPSPALPPTELWLLRPDCMRAIPADGGTVGTWEYRNGKGKVDFDMRKKVYGTTPIFQWRTFNPLSDWYGLPPLRAASMQLSQHNNGARWNASVLQNGMRPSGMFSYADTSGSGANLTTTQIEALKAQYADQMSGPDNAGTPIIGEYLTWQEMSINPKDMDWIEGMRDAARIICLIFGVPPILLNIPGDNTYKNYEEAREAAYMDSAIPLMRGLVDELNYWLTPIFGVGIRLELDLDKVEALAALRARTWDRANACTFASTNEKRAMVGLPIRDKTYEPESINDEILVSSSVMPLSMAGELPEDDPALTDENDDASEDDDEDEDPKPGKKPVKPGKPKKHLNGHGDPFKRLELNLLTFSR